MRTLIAPVLVLVTLLTFGCGKRSVEVAGLDAKQSGVIDKMVLKGVEKQWLDQARSVGEDFAAMRSADDDTSYAAGWPFPNSGFKIATAAKFHIHYRRGEDVTVTPTTESFTIELTAPLKLAETSLPAGTQLARAKGGGWSIGDSVVQHEKPATPHTEPLSALPQDTPNGARTNGVADILAKWRPIIPTIPDEFLVVYVGASRMLMTDNSDATYRFTPNIKAVTVDLPLGVTLHSMGSGVQVELESPPPPEVLGLMEEKLKHRKVTSLDEVDLSVWCGRGKKEGASAVHAGEVWRRAEMKAREQLGKESWGEWLAVPGDKHIQLDIAELATDRNGDLTANYPAIRDEANRICDKYASRMRSEEDVHALANEIGVKLKLPANRRVRITVSTTASKVALLGEVMADGDGTFRIFNRKRQQVTGRTLLAP